MLREIGVGGEGDLAQWHVVGAQALAWNWRFDARCRARIMIAAAAQAYLPGEGPSRAPLKPLTAPAALNPQGPPRSGPRCEDAMPTGHKFKIGRLVVFRLGWRSQVDAARGVYQIIRRLPPAEDG